MAKKRAARTIVGEPMTPDLMVRIGGLTSLPETPDNFRPEAGWVNKYRIHTCHGYFESGNLNVGVLRIERIVKQAEQGFTLKLRQQIVHDTGQTHYMDAWVQCRDDAVASLAGWRLLSRFEDISGGEMPDLGGEENGKLAGAALEITRDGTVRKIEAAGAVTSDWSLFEAVQRLPFGNLDLPEFDLLEGLSLHRVGHRLRYRGLYRPKQLHSAPLRWFQQIGYGLLPYEYWLDGNHRLLAVATQARAYILDDRAEEKLAARLQQIRDRRSRRKRNG